MPDGNPYRGCLWATPIGVVSRQPVRVASRQPLSMLTLYLSCRNNPIGDVSGNCCCLRQLLLRMPSGSPLNTPHRCCHCVVPICVVSSQHCQNLLRTNPQGCLRVYKILHGLVMCNIFVDVQCSLFVAHITVVSPFPFYAGSVFPV